MLIKFDDHYFYIQAEDVEDFNLLAKLFEPIDGVNLVQNTYYTFKIDESAIKQVDGALTKGYPKEKTRKDPTFVAWVAKNISKVKPVRFAVGPVYTAIVTNGNDIPKTQLKDAMKYFTKSATRSRAYLNKKWDGYINLLDLRHMKFPTGLLEDACKILHENKVPYEIEYLYDTAPPKEFKWKAADLFEPTQDQLEAVQACVKHKRGICKAPTSFGKTSMLSRYVICEFAVPTLFVANRKTLLDDAASDFIKGIEGLKESEVGEIKDGIYGKKNDKTVNIDKYKIVCATIQSLHAKLFPLKETEESRKIADDLKEWLQERCKLLIVDETQAVGTRQWDEVLSVINSPYRVFLSATPKRTDGASIKIKAYSGPTMFSTFAATQVEQGRLSELNIEYYPFDHKMYNEGDSDLEYQTMYTQCIVESDERNEFIVDKVFEMLGEERFVLVLIQRLEHGERLKKMIIEKGLPDTDIVYINGSDSDKKRHKALNDFRKGKVRVFIGSTIMDVGVSVNTISGIILTGAGNSEITLIQRIGRALRNCDYEKEVGFTPKFIKQANGEKVARIIDIWDCNVKFFNYQAKNRFNNAKEEFESSRVHLMGEFPPKMRKSSKGISQAEADAALEELLSGNKMNYDDIF